ncbi:unnamed protein product [Caretta caretta]
MPTHHGTHPASSQLPKREQVKPRKVQTPMEQVWVDHRGPVTSSSIQPYSSTQRGLFKPINRIFWTPNTGTRIMGRACSWTYLELPNNLAVPKHQAMSW